MDGKSITPQGEKLKQLQSILPEAFTEGKADWEKLKAALGEDINFSNERYVLNWAGKSDAFKVLQTPSSRTLIPAKDESVNFDETENIFIEGENLEVLKVLQKSYFGKVKMIYIDPPYNTGNDSFIYPDNFSESADEYRKRVGDTDENGYMTKEGLFRKNSKENGQYHSNWLNMMYPRLFLAKNLLRQDGVIFVSIDENEQHNLKLCLNEIFGEENFVCEFIWKNKHGGGGDSPYAVKEHEYIYCYTKNISELPELFASPPPDYEKMFREKDERGDFYYDRLDKKGIDANRPNLIYSIECPDGTIKDISPAIWRLSKEEFERRKDNNEVGFKKDKNSEWQIYTKTYLKDEDGNQRRVKARSVLKQEIVGFTQNGNKEITELFGKKLFQNPKPISLIKYLVDYICRDTSDIILDYFSGSASTAHAVFALNKEDGGNRKFICVQLPELCDEKSEAHKAGYKTIADIAKERIRRVIRKIKYEEEDKLDFGESKQDLGFKVFKLADSNFKQWRSDLGKDVDALKQQIIEFIDPVASNATVENMVYELLLKSGKDLNSKLEHKDNYCCVNHNELVLMLEKADHDTVDAVLKENPQKVIALDRIFEGNDRLKTNTALQMRDADIEFKTI